MCFVGFRGWVVEVAGPFGTAHGKMRAYPGFADSPGAIFAKPFGLKMVRIVVCETSRASRLLRRFVLVIGVRGMHGEEARRGVDV